MEIENCSLRIRRRKKYKCAAHQWNILIIFFEGSLYMDATGGVSHCGY